MNQSYSFSLFSRLPETNYHTEIKSSTPEFSVQSEAAVIQSSNSTTLIAIAVVMILSGVGIGFLKSFLCICQPNEVVILAGRKWKRRDGRLQGYRVLQGGRAIRIPLLETIKKMDMTTMPVRVEVHNAYSKGGIPLHIQAIANIRISNDPIIIGNAIERFLGHKRSEIIRVAQETLEGYLRGVVATLTPEQVNEDRLKFAERIASDISQDLNQLGLQLDILKIQNVSDDVDYLRSLGRMQIAEILRDAEIAESDCLSQAEMVEAACQEKARVAQTENQIITLEAGNHLRRVVAKLEKQAKSAEEITIAETAARKARIEQVLQTFRTKVEKLRLESEQILPAKAQLQAAEYRAKGEAAIHQEVASATAMVNDMLAEVWTKVGPEASEVVVIQQLEQVLMEATKIPERLKLKNISVVDGGDGEAIASLLKVYPTVLNQFLGSVHQLLGIDVVGTLQAKSMTGYQTSESQSVESQSFDSWNDAAQHTDSSLTALRSP